MKVRVDADLLIQLLNATNRSPCELRRDTLKGSPCLEDPVPALHREVYLAKNLATVFRLEALSEASLRELWCSQGGAFEGRMSGAVMPEKKIFEFLRAVLAGAEADCRGRLTIMQSSILYTLAEDLVIHAERIGHAYTQAEIGTLQDLLKTRIESIMSLERQNTELRHNNHEPNKHDLGEL